MCLLYLCVLIMALSKEKFLQQSPEDPRTEKRELGGENILGVSEPNTEEEVHILDSQNWHDPG